MGGSKITMGKYIERFTKNHCIYFIKHDSQENLKLQRNFKTFENMKK